MLGGSKCFVVRREAQEIVEALADEVGSYTGGLARRARELERRMRWRRHRSDALCIKKAAALRPAAVLAAWRRQFPVSGCSCYEALDAALCSLVQKQRWRRRAKLQLKLEPLCAVIPSQEKWFLSNEIPSRSDH